jgi:hypothetical protein
MPRTMPPCEDVTPGSASRAWSVLFDDLQRVIGGRHIPGQRADRDPVHAGFRDGAQGRHADAALRPIAGAVGQAAPADDGGLAALRKTERNGETGQAGAGDGDIEVPGQAASRIRSSCLCGQKKDGPSNGVVIRAKRAPWVPYQVPVRLIKAVLAAGVAWRLKRIQFFHCNCS